MAVLVEVPGDVFEWAGDCADFSKPAKTRLPPNRAVVTSMTATATQYTCKLSSAFAVRSAHKTTAPPCDSCPLFSRN